MRYVRMEELAYEKLELRIESPNEPETYMVLKTGNVGAEPKFEEEAMEARALGFSASVWLVSHQHFATKLKAEKFRDKKYKAR